MADGPRAFSLKIVLFFDPSQVSGHSQNKDSPIKLVDENLTVHIFNCHDEFRSYCSSHGLKKSNMDELLAGGSGKREDVNSSFKYGHAQLCKLRWIRSDAGVFMPIISYDNAVKALSELGYNVD